MGDVLKDHGISWNTNTQIPKYPKHDGNNHGKTPFKQSSATTPISSCFDPSHWLRNARLWLPGTWTKFGRFLLWQKTARPLFFTKLKILKFLSSLGHIEIRSIWASAIHRCSGSSLISEEFAWTNMKWTSYQHLLGILIVFFCFPSQYKSQNKESWVD